MHGELPGVCREIESQMGIVYIISRWREIWVPILLCVSVVLISVIKLWDMIIGLWMCKGQTHHLKVLESKWRCMTAKTFDFFLQVTVKWESTSWISDEINKQNLSGWCQTTDRGSGRCPIWICLNDYRYAAFIHASKCITLRTDLVHTVEIIEFAYSTSWKSRRRSWMRKGEEV